MGQIDSSFFSCQGLQDLFGPLSPDLVALQLSRGPLLGRLRSFHLGAIRFNLLETNRSLFLSGTRRPKPCTVAIPLEKPQATSPYRAQGIPVEWPALMGYNRHLTDFDLRLPAGAKLATIVIGKEVLLEQLDLRGGSQRTLERWESSNQLELLPELQQRLRDQLNQLIQRDAQGWNPEDPDQLIDSVIRCFEEPMARTRPIAKREARHEAAIDLLHWCSRNPMTPVSVEELSAELFQSRTSLFKGSKEHFEQTPLELQRSVRMDRVRQLLQDPARRASQGLTGVRDTAAFMGFTSRSHFARRYQEYYGEQPQDTLAKSLKGRT
ncbi:helix-turn-helix domain-containing protein [Synechococcus sp. MU1617]|uniref:helix-turn-helix domain-containing protein n=1 Tax=Synechococcus sp. MU1617 TaxID=2508346 RepID=UPI001CF8FA01|nr:helix-turn-helix transcriptional regulator [Synechococcus sp. MU1617]